MFIITAKLSKEKIIIAALILAALICLICVLVAGSSNSSGTELPAKTVVSYKNIGSNDDRTALLESYGWLVSQEPVETIEVKIPSESSEVFDKYNELQLSQGFDLTKYAGKNVKKYTYEVSNHPTGVKDVVATLLVYKKTVIGGDVSSREVPGFMHGLDYPASTATEISSQSDLSEASDVLIETDPGADVEASKAVIPAPLEGSGSGDDPGTGSGSDTPKAAGDAAASGDATLDDSLVESSAISSHIISDLPVTVDSSDSVAASSIVPETKVLH